MPALVLLAMAVPPAFLAAPTPVAAATTLTVTSAVDAVDTNPGDGQCNTGSGTCTLRAAIQEANALGGPDTINLPAGTYLLTVFGAAEDLAGSGDLDITGPVTIVGAGAGSAIIDGAGNDRVVHLTETAGSVWLNGLTIRGGVTEEDGGGVYSFTSGTLTLDGATVTGNTTASDGGGIHIASGNLVVRNSTISANTARNGGGVYNGGELSLVGVPSQLTMTSSTVADNVAVEGGGGGIWGDHESVLSLTGVTVSGNFANDNGGGISVASRSRLTMSGGSVTGNSAHGDGGGISTATERGVTISGTTFSGNEAGVAVEGEAGGGGGGALASGGMGVVEISGATFEGNSAPGEGGAIYLDNNGSVTISNSAVRNNHSGAGGGGIQNAATRVTFTGLTITGNRADLDGGGIESQGSGQFTIVDTTISGNIAENGGGFANAADGATRIERTLIWDNRAVVGLNDDSGLGGGVYSLGDASANYENVTITGNFAQVRGGGFYVDADAGVRVSSSTIVGNSAPLASGLGGEIGSVNFPVQPSTGVVLRNTIVAGNLMGPNCSFSIGSEGGNLQGDPSCGFIGTNDRTIANPGLDAVANNGGPTMTMAIQPESLALDGGVGPCPVTDQRGVARPQNGVCDSGAFESTGPFPPPDSEPPDTQYLTGPTQDTEATSIFTFTGTDNATPPEFLIFECRLIETEIGEPPEPPDPTAPPEPELAWLGCQNPWQVPLIEDGLFSFEVRAIDRAGNVDPTPAIHTFGGTVDVTPPQTFFLETPPNPSYSNSATFTFGATDDQTPPQFMEIECRIDTQDPNAWLECTNPTVFTNLTVGTHYVEARAADGADNVDPSPARYEWTVAPPLDCDLANITLTASADVYVDQISPQENFVVNPQLVVRSADLAGNARTLIEFPLSNDAPGCTLESATMRLYAGSSDAGRTLQAIPLAEAWAENGATWLNQPATTGGAITTTSGDGYREWNVTSQVAAMLDGSLPNHGWLIRDAVEDEVEGGEQAFLSRETAQDPPVVTLPQLVLRFDESGTPPPPPPAAGSAGNVVCGQVLTESIVVQNDLIGCLGEGLVVGAPDIVVDLNGHTISSGVVLEPGEEDGLLAGIRNSGHANVVIKNGTVLNFGYGVRLLAGARYNVVENMTLRGNVNAGIDLLDADDGRHGNIIRNNTFELNGDGVSLFSGSEGSTIIGNTFTGNLGRAIYSFDSSHNRFENNIVSGLTNDPLLDSDGGIFLEGSTDNVVIGNTISDAGDAGILVSDGSHRNRLEANTIFRTSDSSISVAGSDGTIIVGNTVHVAGGAGIGLNGAHDGEIVGNDVRFNPSGIELGGSDGNLVEDNDATASQAGGISIEGGLGNIIRNNLANDTGATGISVEAEAVDTLGNPIPGNVVEGNTANGNLGDGISVSAGGHVVTANAAFNNAAFGISAGELVVDGGGNTASGNGEPEQCVGVVCTPGSGAPPATPDLTAPDTQILTAPTGGSTFDSHTFTFTGSDNVAPATALRFECRLDAPPDPPAEPPEPPEPGEPPEPVQPPDSETWLDCASPVIYTLLTSGSHTFEVRALDPFDNVDLTPAVHTWTVVAGPPGADSVPPSTTIFAAPTDPSTSTTATFEFGGSDNTTPGPNLVYECSLDGTAFATCTSPAVYSGLGLGTHTFDVRAVDVQGNADATPASHTWTIEEPPADVTPPDTFIDSAPDATTVSTDATFTFSTDEDDSTFECSLDGAGFAPCTSPVSYTGMGVGAHTFAVRAVDDDDNVDPTPATFDWTVGPPPVSANVSCGQVITQSTKLTNDLLECPGDGIVIAADGITLDLDGHTIGGTGLAFGVLNNGFDSVTITNGTIQEFDAGVQLGNGTAHNIVSGLTLQLNELAGVQMTNADAGGAGNVVRHNLVAGNGGGIALLSGTQHARVHDNVLSGSSGESIAILASSSNRIEHNTVSGSSDISILLEGAGGNVVTGNSVFGSADSSIVVHLGSNGNRIESNDLDEGEAGIIVEESSGNELIGNVAHHMGDSGIVLEAASNTLVRGNDVRFNTGGIEVSGSTDNRIESNNASETGGTGIEVGDGSIRNVFVLNVANANEAGGISIEAFAAPGSGNLIDRNTANDNTGVGISVGNVGHMIVGNQAHHNESWGIYAADGTVAGINIDGGGNFATGNTGGIVDPLTLDPLQCYNVVCDGGAPATSDAIAPTTAISSAPVSPTLLTTATFRFTGSDNASTIRFECRIDSTDAAGFEPCTSPHVVSGLSIGTHTFEVRAIDFSGNIDQTPASHTWTIEAPAPGVPPETTIDSGPDATTVSTTATFSFSANEPDVTFECSLDGATFAPCSTPHTYSALGVGGHTFEVRAIDPESNVDGTPASYAWTVSAPPAPGAVSCGQVITTSRLVTNDLLDCNGNGLIIGANGITVDLGGHTIDGIGLGIGIVNNGFDSVTITNGVVQEFDFGVQLNDGTALNIVSELTLQFNQEAGILLVDADDGTNGNIVRDNTLIDNALGIWLSDGTQHALVRGNDVSSTSGDGIRLDGSSTNRIEENTINESSGAGIALAGGSGNTVTGNTISSSSGPGIAVGETDLPSNDNLIERNSITAASGGGIEVLGSAGNDIIGNTVHQSSGSGVSLEGASGTLVRGNDVSGNAGGIELMGSSDNRIEGNNASGSNGTGISLEGGSFRNVIVFNNVSGNSGEGIYVNDSTDAANGNLIDNNIASSNSGVGIIVNGAGHTVTGNTVNFNDGWGILAGPGTIDGGGNEATGNAEPAQCSGVVCTIGLAPGAPDTTIIDKPADPSSSQNALFTFIGTDDTTSLFDLGFQCRLDSTDELAWEDCENPWEIFGLSPGSHTFEVRAVDAGEQVDPTPATYTWTYVALPTGIAPDTFIDIAPPLDSPLLEGVFTFSSNEPDVTFECSLDGAPFDACEFAFEFAFEDFQVGEHTFQVRATDFEGNTDPTPATYTWNVGGIITIVTDGPAFEPGAEPGEPATGGETTSTSAVIVFEANVADATFICSLDFGVFVPCTSPVTYTDLAVGEHLFQVLATDPETETTQLEVTEYEWTVLPGEDTVPPNTVLLTAPATGTSDTVFTFTGTDNVTQPLALTFECRLDSTSELDWFECVSPLNLLEAFPELAPGAHTLEIRANDNAEPLDPNSTFEGNVDPTPIVHTWTSAADTTPPATTLLVTPTTPTIEPDVVFAFAGADNATPELLLAFECSVDGATFEPCGSPASVQGLEPGSHTFAVRAVDLAGNPDGSPAEFTWTLVGPPVTTFTVTPDLVSPTQDATFEFAADQAGSTFVCAVDGGTAEPCTSPVTLEGLANGEHTFEVVATNTYGLAEAEAATFTWTVAATADTTPPVTTLTPAPDVILVGDIVFTFSSNEVGSTFLCSVDGATAQACASPYEVSGLLDGEHTFSVQAVDAAGNADPTPETHAWTVDLPPLAEILTGPQEITESTSATFTFAANEVVAGFECFLDGITAPCSSPVDYTGLSVGEHVFAVRAIDDTPSSAAAFEDHDWTIVAPAPPATTFVAGPAALTIETTATFTFTGTDNVTPEAALTFECSLDGAAFVACTSPHEVSGLGEGLHTMEVRAVDASATADPTPALYTWAVVVPDTTAPETNIVAGPVASTTSTEATIGFTASEPGSTFECSLDGQPFAACTPPVTLTDLPLGPHSFEVRATDTAGNTDPTTASWTWTVVPDTTAPETVIVAGPLGLNGAVDVVFDFAGTDDTSSATDLEFECSFDGAAFTSCDAPYPIQALALGEHTFEVRAIDAALNVDPTPATRTWTTVDLVAPDTSIDSGPASPTEATSATFTFSSDEAGSTFECSLDVAPFTACTTPHAVSGLGVGEHTMRVRARDASGNADTSPDVHAWTVVAPTPPQTSIVTGPATSTESPDAIFTFSSDQLGTTFECSLDGATFAECESPYELEGLAAGTHVLEVRAVNAADLPDPTPATYTWTIGDLTPPQTAIDSGPAASTTSTTASFTFSASEAGSTFSCSLDGAAFAPCTSPVNLSGLSVATHTFSVRAVDAAGNADATPATFTWTVTAPTPTCTTTSTTLIANADAWIEQNSPSSNKGTDSNLKVKSQGSSDNFRSLVAFPMPPMPAGCVVQSATLRLNANSASSGRTIQAIRLAGAWTENGVTWGNQPATTGPAATTSSGTGWRQWTVTSQVQAMYDAGALHGFLVRDATEGANGAEQQYRTRHGSNNTRPQLVLSFGPGAAPPPPDTTPPDTSITAQPTNPAPDGSASFGFTGTDNVTPGGSLTYECRLDGAAFAVCTSPTAYTGLAATSHTFEVRAKDAAGNVDPTPASYTWTVSAPAAPPPPPPPPPPDTDPPETTITSSPDLSTTSTSASFAFASDEAGSTFTCSLDGAPAAACTSPAAHSGLAPGPHTFSVAATDAAGNVDPTPASHGWTITVATCTAGSVTVGSVADSWVLQSSPSSNYATDSTAKVVSKSNDNARVLVRFDLPAVPAGCSVTGATLRLYAGSSNSGRTLQALQIGAAWTEAGVTWANQPATTGTASTVSSGSGWRQWNVLAQVQSMYATVNHGFLIRDASENNSGAEQQFHTKEKAPDNPPQLVITYA